MAMVDWYISINEHCNWNKTYSTTPLIILSDLNVQVVCSKVSKNMRRPYGYSEYILGNLLDSL
jgi:hypothetical protein